MLYSNGLLLIVPPFRPPAEFFLHADSNIFTSHVTFQLRIPQWIPYRKDKVFTP